MSPIPFALGFVVGFVAGAIVATLWLVATWV